jgi:hypothetical protein
MKRGILAIALAALVGVGAAQAQITTFPLEFNGAQEGVGDPDGTGSGTITFDQTLNKISWNFVYANIATPSLMHIHTGQDGVNGGILVGLGVTTSGGPGTLISSVNTSAANINAVLANPVGFYVNIHNGPFPNGAIRAQIPKMFEVGLMGMQEVGGGDPDGFAHGTIIFDTGMNKVSWSFFYHDIAAPSDFHIHGPAPICQNATVYQNLGVAGGPEELVGSAPMTDALIDPLLANPANFYLNIHNADFPGGALRGQIIYTPVFGDFNGDCVVDGADLGLLLSAWDSTDETFDLNDDNIVDGADLGLLLSSWS